MKQFDLFDEVGIEITLNRVAQFLNENKEEDIEFNVSTLGGNLAVGLAIYSLLKLHKGKTTACLVGHTASAGTIIAMGCDEVYISPFSMFLIHDSRIETRGTADSLRETAIHLERNDEMMISIYQKETNLTRDEIISLMKAEDWLSSDQAIEYGFANGEIKELSIAAKASNTQFLTDKLITKLNSKMQLFGKKEKANSVFAHVLSDNSQIIASTKVLDEGTEVQAIGANAEIPDGEYESKDGKKFSVKGGKVQKIEKEGEPSESDDIDAIVSVVSDVVATIVAPLQNEINGLKDDLAKAKASKSTHTPPKSDGIQANTEKPVFSAEIIGSKLNREIKAKLIEEREGR